MQAVVVLFETLVRGMLFIKAEIADSYQIFEKTEPSAAKIYGKGGLMVFNRKQHVIVVTEMPFVQVPMESQIVTIQSAKAVGGFLVPRDVLVKCPNGFAEYVDVRSPVKQERIDGNVPVMNLDHTFNFETHTEAELNT